MICLNCGNSLVKHAGAGRGQYKDYPDLLICEQCWHKYVEREGKLIRVKAKRRIRC